MAINHFINGKAATTLLFIMLIIVFNAWEFREAEGMRPLEGEEWMKKELLIQSLSRGPIPPFDANPCTYIPDRGGRGRCTLAQYEMNFIGQAPSTTFPHDMVHLGVASNNIND